MRQYPDNWQVRQLCEIADTISGGTPSRRNPNYFKGNIPWLKSGELNDGIILEYGEGITDQAIKDSNARIIPKGTLLIALYGATVGRLGILGIDAATNQAVCSIVPKTDVNNKFLFWYLFRLRPKLLSLRTGGAQPNISQQILRKIDVPFPNLVEQQRIVAKIEELFSDLDKAVESLKKAQAQLKTYRQAILKYAFEGRFTHKNIKPGQLPEGWKWVRLGEQLLFIGSGITPKGGKSVYKTVGVMFIRSQNVYPNELVLEDIAFITKEIDKRMSRSRIRPHDVLLNITGASIGRSATVPAKFPEANVNQHVCILRFDTSVISSSYVCHYLNSPHVQKYIMQNQIGATRQGLNYQQIREFPFPLCNIGTQNEVISEIETRLSEADYMEKTIIQSIEKSEATRQSILKKAFEGRLV